MPNADALQAAIDPLNRKLVGLLTADVFSPWAGRLMGVFVLIEFTLIVLLLTGVAAALRTVTLVPPDSRRGRSRALPLLAAALVASGLFAWCVRTPSGDITGVVHRWDHLVFAAAAGFALSGLAQRWRRYALSALSLYFIAAHGGPRPTAILVAGSLLGVALLSVPGGQRRWATVLLQSVALLGTFAIIWLLRRENLRLALYTQAPFAFLLLRHISFVVEARRGRPAGLGDYLCYQFFYPNFVGASEVYSEFHDRNLAADARYDYRAAAAKLIGGRLQLWAGLQIPVTFDAVIHIREPLLLWASVLPLFVSAALFTMGVWSTIEGVAYLYGIQLRPNFAGALTCLNPAQFWRSWRATMTNWLIQYVYIPLGGNRHHQGRNIAAAFAVSVIWHWMGIPFLTLAPTVSDFVPIGLWGLINAAGVAAYVRFRRLNRTILPAATPRPIRTASKMALTGAFGTFTVTLLTFTPSTIQFFVPFLRTLLGLRTP